MLMTIYGNDAINQKNVEFKIWDASTGTIYSNLTTSQNVTFSNGGIIGTFNDPVTISTSDKVEQQISLNKGWNWTSFFVTPSPNTVGNVMGRYADNITVVKDRTSFSMSNGNGYEGSLSTMSGAALYMMYTAAPVTFIINGAPLTAEEGRQTVAPNWNWLGNVVQSAMTLERAFAGLNPTTNDLIKSRNAFAIYNGNEWEGTLTYIEPGMGYMYHSESSDTLKFTYPASSAADGMMAPARMMSSERSYFNVGDMSNYSGNMTVVAQVFINGVRTDNLELAAFAGQECRAIATAVGERYYITIPGDGSGTAIDMYAYFEGGEYKLTPAISYANDAMIGTLEQPLRLEMNVTGLLGAIIEAKDIRDNLLTTAEIKDTLGVAIDIAQGIYNDRASKTEAEIEAAVSDLNDAVITARNAQGSHDVVDGTPYSYTREVEVPQLTYTRNYNGGWQALYVPFAMDFDDLAADFDVAYINGMRLFDNDEDGVIDQSFMDVVLMTGGTIEANTPYLIRAHKTGVQNIVINNAVLMKAQENSVDCSTTVATYTITGTYHEIAGDVMYDNDWYALGRDAETGAACLIGSNGNPDNVLKPNRWYMKAKQRDGAPYTLPTHMSRISVRFENMPTGIDGISDFNIDGNGDAFDLGGRRITVPVNGDMFIMDGKKVMIK